MSVRRVLENEVYIGTLTQGKHSTPNHKIKKIMEKPEEEWIRMLDRVANESFGMYRDALVLEMEKTGMVSIPKTKCLEITADSVKIENADGIQTLPADTVIYALGMKSVCTKELEETAKEIGAQCHVIGDAIQPAKVDKATRTAYLAAIEIGK